MKQSENSGLTYYFGGWTFLVDSNQLVKGKYTTSLEVKVAATLLQLLKSAPSPVSKEELIESVWLGVVVSDGAIYNTINKLRRIFREDQDDLKFIETIPKIGYRLIADIESPDKQNPSVAFTKPSIAVLPFVNMSGDPEQEYFSDGITEDIITELSRFPELAVISRTSTFTYKNKAVTVAQVTKELGVQFVLEGSMRRTEEKFLVSVQLIDGTTGAHIWSERYERSLSELHAAMGELLQKIVSIVAGRVENVGLRIAKRKLTKNLSAYEHVLQGGALYLNFDELSNKQARDHFSQAVSLDPLYSRAHVGLAGTYFHEYVYGWTKDLNESFRKLRKHTLQAIELNDQDNFARLRLAQVRLIEGHLEAAVAEYEKAITLNPNDANILASGSYGMIYQGKFEKAIDQVKKAMRLNPFHPDYYHDAMGWAYFFLEQYEEALFEVIQITEPSAGEHRNLAAIYARRGQKKMAKFHANQVLILEPNFMVGTFSKTMHFKNPKYKEFFLSALRMAGLPD